MPKPGQDLAPLIARAPDLFRPFAEKTFPAIFHALDEASINAPQEQAYVFATLHHECGCGKWMEEIWQPSEIQLGYEGRLDLGNVEPGDGYKFRGRGFVQLTGRTNYLDWSERLGLDLAEKPDLAKQAPIAAKILVLGMKLGTFRGCKLTDFHGENGYDYWAARNIVNGDRDRFVKALGCTVGEHLAALARGYQSALP